MITDIVFEPFGADAAAMVAAAALVDRDDLGYGGVWVYDHFTAMMTAPNRKAPGPAWSRDPFALLGAYATVTNRVRIGTLVANIYNRHPVQLASAINTVQSLAGQSLAGQSLAGQSLAGQSLAGRPGRVICGLGSGAAPGSRFAAEQDAIGTALDDAIGRRERLIATISELRIIWGTNALGPANRIVDQSTTPQIVVGASGPLTVRAAAQHADGVNIRMGDRIDELVAIAREIGGPDFEVSVLTTFDPDHRLGGEIDRLAELDIDRRVLAVRAPIPFAQLESVGLSIAATMH